MRHQQKIYNQNGNFMRNKNSLNVNMSSDVCIFSAPTFNMGGATKIETGTTSASTGVYIVEDNSGEISLLFNFTGDTSSLDSKSEFKYEIYKYDYNKQVFLEPALIKSGDIPYSAFSATLILDQTISISELNHDGEYLVKGYYSHGVCTDILSRLGERDDTSFYKKGSLYGLYNPSTDYSFAVIEMAKTPIFTTTTGANSRPLGSLVVKTQFPEDGEREFPITIDVNGELLVYLNGIMLAEDLDYVLTSNDTLLRLTGETFSGDVLTYVAVSDSESNGLVVDTIEVQDPIPSGVTDAQGLSKYYYNTTQRKYELYTVLTPLDSNNVVVTLNGATLAPFVDYYQSTSNPNRIILEGNLLDGDIINVVYNAYPSYVGEVFTNTPLIIWTIPAPQSDNGIFTVEVGTDSTFNKLVATAQTEYVANEVSYSSEITLTGSVGTNLVYRVLNEKNYVTLDGDIITTSAYSEVVPITIMSNSINSY